MYVSSYIKIVNFWEYLKLTISAMIAGSGGGRGRRCTYGDIRRYTCADISVDLQRGSLFEGVSTSQIFLIPRTHQ